MKNILIINAGQNFGHSGGKFNRTVAEKSLSFLEDKENVTVKITHIAEGYDIKEELEKFAQADLIIYHTPIWWFQVPFAFKEYIDKVFTAGHKVLYYSDGRKEENPEINYGTGGLLHGKKYMLTTTWNAPSTAFTLPNEFFKEQSVDDGPLYGFHKMNAFIGLTGLKSFHFHDVEKNTAIERDMKNYEQHLKEVLLDSKFI